MSEHTVCSSCRVDGTCPNDVPTVVVDYHLAGDAWCDCPSEVDHESNDPEADAAWDRSGPMGIAQLHAERQAAHIARLTAVAEAARALYDVVDPTDCYESEHCALGVALEALDGGDRG